MAGGSPGPGGISGLSSDLLVDLGCVLASGPVVVQRDPGSGTTGGDAYTFMVPPDVWASDTTLRALVAAARTQSSAVSSLAALELASVPAGMDVDAAIRLHASGGAAVSDAGQAAPAALLAPNTAFDVTAGDVRWTGPAIHVPDARVATAHTQFATGPATRAARPVFRRSTVVAVVALPAWTERLVAWIDAHRDDPSIDLRIIGAPDGAPSGCAPATGLESIRTFRPDVVVLDAGQSPAGLEDALQPLSRAVVVELADGAACVSHAPGGRLRGTLGVDLDRDATVAALARWASGPSVTSPTIVSPDVPGGTHVRHAVPRHPAPVRSLGLLANGDHAHGRFTALADVCAGMPDLATAVLPSLSDALPDVLFVGGPLAAARDDVVDAARSGIGVAIDVYGVDPSEDLAGLPADVRQRLVLLAGGRAAGRRLEAVVGAPVVVLPAVPAGPEPLASGVGGTLVLATAAAGSDAIERALAAVDGGSRGRTDFVGAPGPAAWVALPPAPRQLAADADLVVLAGGGRLDGVVLDTTALAARTGAVVVAQGSDELQDLVDPRGLVEVVDGDWDGAVARAWDLVGRGVGAHVQSAARAWTGVQATRARVRRAVTVAMGRATR